MLSYEQARSKVVAEVGKRKAPRATTVVSVWEAVGMVLAQEVRTDREYPPFNRSTRDGYAVRLSEAGPDARTKCLEKSKRATRPGNPYHRPPPRRPSPSPT